MTKLLDSLRSHGRSLIRLLARGLNDISGGRLSPNAVTMTGLVMHLPIAYLIATERLIPAGILLIVFGLFDTLDGELARLQNRASAKGMFLDSVTDRIKEVMIYVGVSFLAVSLERPEFAIWTVLAAGLAVTVSYINAIGEVAMAKHGKTDHQVNKTFRGGLASYDIRIALIIIGLLFGVLEYMVVLIAILSAITVLQRISSVMKRLS